MTLLSGRLVGAHQKIDRVARRHLQQLLPKNNFPKIRSILHFEGGNGPDAIKRKSPAKNEPWHYILPFDATDRQLVGLIAGHYELLVKALIDKDDVRASFEAAWLAHAVVDGLTPAHHYPYEEKLVELMSGQGIDTRTSVKDKIVMPGHTRKHQFKNNWKMWGPKGLFTTHAAFEWGVATLMVPMKLGSCQPTVQEFSDFKSQPIDVWFRGLAQDIARLELYDAFYKTGWTIPLARRIRRKLAPTLVQAVTTVWYGAQDEANRAKAK